MITFLTLGLSIAIFVFIIYELVTFYQNYDYVLSYIERYKKYLFINYPLKNHTDTNVFDPNDNFDKPKNKWRCKQYSENNKWYAIKENSMVYINGKFEDFSSKIECYTYIFTNIIISMNNPCDFSNDACIIYKDLY